MKPEILTLVEEALNAGMYPAKIEGILSGVSSETMQPSFDFLGILCDLSRLGYWVTCRATTSTPLQVDYGRIYVVDGESFTSILPAKVADWAGVSPQEERQISRWNDHAVANTIIRFSFRDIIALIRRQENANESVDNRSNCT